MQDVPEIDLSAARAQHAKGEALFVDIRDPDTRAQAGHIAGDRHLISQESYETFLAEVPRDRTVIVYCYTGRSSLGAVAQLLEDGFTEASSLSGGYTLWAQTENESKP